MSFVFLFFCRAVTVTQQVFSCHSTDISVLVLGNRFTEVPRRMIIQLYTHAYLLAEISKTIAAS